MRLKSGISKIIQVKAPLKSSSFNLYIVRKKRNPFFIFYSFINLPVKLQLILLATSGSAIIVLLLTQSEKQNKLKIEDRSSKRTDGHSW